MTYEEILNDEYGKEILSSIFSDVSVSPSSESMNLLLRLRENLQSSLNADLKSQNDLENACAESLLLYETHLNSTNDQIDQARNALEQLEKKFNQWDTKVKQLKNEINNYNIIKSNIYELENLQDLKNSEELLVNNQFFDVKTENFLDFTDLNSENSEKNIQKIEKTAESEYKKAFTDYLEEIEKELKDLNKELKYSEKNANEWSLKVSECRGHYDESQRRLDQINDLISEKQKLCTRQNNQLKAQTANVQSQLLTIESLVGLIIPTMDQIQSS